MLADLAWIESATSSSQMECASNWATEAGMNLDEELVGLFSDEKD